MTAHKERLSPAIPPDAEAWWEESAHLWRYYYAAERLKKTDALTVADAACGTGYGSAILHAAGFRVDAYDCDSSSVCAASYERRGPSYFMLDLDSDEAVFDADALVCLETLEHLRDPWLFLARLPSTVRHLIASTPIVPNSNPYNPYHRHDFTLESFEAMVRGAGFEIQDRVLQSSPWRINLYAVVHAVRPES